VPRNAEHSIPEQSPVQPPALAAETDHAPSLGLVRNSFVASAALTPGHLLHLQRTAGNQAVGRALAARPVLQRAIDPNKAEYVNNQRVKRTDGELGPGTIVEVAGLGYTVAFDTGDTMYVPALDLDLLDDAEEPDSPTPEHKEAPKDEAEVKETKAPTYDPVTLLVGDASQKSRYKLTLLDAEGTAVGSQDNVPNAEVKSYITPNAKALVENTTTKARNGTFTLKASAVLPVKLQEAHKKFKDVKRQEAAFAKSDAGQTNAETGPPPSQDTALKRIDELYKHVDNSRGNDKVQMAKIKLLKPLKLRVGGEERTITHLYTQVGRDIERRCYLGNAEGAYQRVHTSLTGDKEMTAHTMVQTGPAVAVPKLRAGGTRVGYDSKEGQTPGYAKRPLTNRSVDQSTVVGTLQGQNPDALDDDTYLGTKALSERFNKALDAALADANLQDAKTRDVSRAGPGFKILDDEWTFKSKTATPTEELAETIPSVLSGALESTDEAINHTVDIFAGVPEVLKLYNLRYVSGDGWLCFIRAILMRLAEGPGTLVRIYKRLLRRGVNLMDLAGEGIETGSELATQVLTAIAEVTGQKVKITLIRPRKDQAPDTAAGSVGAGTEIFLLHTNLHFTLAIPKQ
jgi:hypothetical protein